MARIRPQQPEFPDIDPGKGQPIPVQGQFGQELLGTRQQFPGVQDGVDGHLSQAGAKRPMAKAKKHPLAAPAASPEAVGRFSADLQFPFQSIQTPGPRLLSVNDLYRRA